MAQNSSFFFCCLCTRQHRTAPPNDMCADKNRHRECVCVHAEHMCIRRTHNALDYEKNKIKTRLWTRETAKLEEFLIKTTLMDGNICNYYNKIKLFVVRNCIIIVCFSEVAWSRFPFHLLCSSNMYMAHRQRLTKNKINCFTSFSFTLLFRFCSVIPRACSQS